MQQQEPHIHYHRTSSDLQLAIILRVLTVTVGVRMFGYTYSLNVTSPLYSDVIMHSDNM